MTPPTFIPVFLHEAEATKDYALGLRDKIHKADPDRHIRRTDTWIENLDEHGLQNMWPVIHIAVTWDTGAKHTISFSPTTMNMDWKIIVSPHHRFLDFRAMSEAVHLEEGPVNAEVQYDAINVGTPKSTTAVDAVISAMQNYDYGRSIIDRLREESRKSAVEHMGETLQEEPLREPTPERDTTITDIMALQDDLEAAFERIKDVRSQAEAYTDEAWRKLAGSTERTLQRQKAYLDQLTGIFERRAEKIEDRLDSMDSYFEARGNVQGDGLQKLDDRLTGALDNIQKRLNDLERPDVDPYYMVGPKGEPSIAKIASDADARLERLEHRHHETEAILEHHRQEIHTLRSEEEAEPISRTIELTAAIWYAKILAKNGTPWMKHYANGFIAASQAELDKLQKQAE